MSRLSFRSLCHVIVVLMFFTLSAYVNGQGQTLGPDPSSDLKTGEALTGGKQSQSGLISDLAKLAAPIENSVNPEHYRLGPNDQFILSIPNLELTVPVIVSIDNQLALPRGFMVDVDGMTLAELRKVVDSLYRSRSPSYSYVGLTLFRSRTIYVTISGNVLMPGRRIMTAADRVATAIDIANQLPENLPLPTKEIGQLAKDRIKGKFVSQGVRDLGNITSGEIPVRFAVVRHNDGTHQQADLIRYAAYGRDEDNPTLREGDVINVQYADPSGAMVSVAGAVNFPMTVPYASGDRALMLLRLAAGFRTDAAPEDAYVARLEGGSIRRIPIDVRDSSGLAAFPLLPGDQLVVPTHEELRATRAGVVAVAGEVVRPATYPIVEGETTLSEVIEMAGGFTADASLNAARIERAIDPRLYRQQKLAADPISGMATSSLTLEDTTRFKFDNLLQENRVSADFVALFVRGDKSKDVLLYNGDQIIVPRNPRNVYVRGRVATPGWVPYMEGKDFEYYVQKAGGYTEAANRDRVQVEKAGSGVWEDAEIAMIMPGDQVYVPGDRDTPARTSLEIAGAIFSIVSSLTLVILQIVDRL